MPATAYFDDPHKFSVHAMPPPVSIAVGSARTARLQYWPALKDLSMYSLRIREEGMREPHWHPITAVTHDDNDWLRRLLQELQGSLRCRCGTDSSGPAGLPART